jgi:hypothetical protein
MRGASRRVGNGELRADREGFDADMVIFRADMVVSRADTVACAPDTAVSHVDTVVSRADTGNFHADMVGFQADMHASRIAGIVICAANSAFRVARREFHRRRPSQLAPERAVEDGGSGASVFG